MFRRLCTWVFDPEKGNTYTIVTKDYAQIDEDQPVVVFKQDLDKFIKDVYNEGYEVGKEESKGLFDYARRIWK